MASCPHPGFAVALVLAGCQGEAGPTEDPGGLPELAGVYELSDPEAWPESVAWDPEGRTFYTSSLARGDLTAVAADGTETVFFAGIGEDGVATVGVGIDAARRRLLACAIRVDGSAPGELWAFDLDSGAELATIDLGLAAAGASCTDVEVDGDGVAYVTDRENATLYRVALEDPTPTVWSDAAALAPDLIGSNGLAFTSDGEFLLVTKYLAAELVRIRISNPTDAVVVALSGDELAGGAALNGADDAVFLGETLYVTLVNRLVRVVPDDSTWASATASSSPLPGGVTGLTVAEGQLYGANGQAVEFTLSQPPALPFRIERIDL